MERQTRQQRRQRARRDIAKGKKAPAKRLNWQLILGAVIVIAALGLFARQVFGSSSSSTGPSASSLLSDNPPIDGVKCATFEGTGYHQHAHLTIYEAGVQLSVPRGIGVSNACLYWVHVHDSSGVIHMEAPAGLVPALKTVLDIWREPTERISRTQIFDTKVKHGQTMKIWVNQQLYAGNPAAIRLRRHTDITVAIGPPFVPPKKFNFGQL